MMIWPFSLLSERAAEAERLRRCNLEMVRAMQTRVHIEAVAQDIERLMGAANGEPLLLEKEKDETDGC